MSAATDRAALFPLATVGDARKLFAAELDREDPDLAFLSVVAGALENRLTTGPTAMPVSTGAAASSSSSESKNNCLLPIDPPLPWDAVEALGAKFEGIIKGYCDTSILGEARKEEAETKSVRALIKHVADIVWNTLSKSHYKDRPHLQSLYSYLTGELSFHLVLTLHFVMAL